MSREKEMFLISGKGSGNAETIGFFRTALLECASPHPHVAYIGTANGDSKWFFEMMENLLLKAGAEEVTFVRLAHARPDTESAMKTIAASDAVFLSGGEVYDGMEGLKKAGLDGYLREQFHAGKLFIGLSAGAIMMGRNWVCLKGENGREADEVFECLALAPTSFDAHAEDEDWIELKKLLHLLGPGAEGRGIRTGGTIRMNKDGAFTDLPGPESILFRNVDGKILVG